MVRAATKPEGKDKVGRSSCLDGISREEEEESGRPSCHSWNEPGMSRTAEKQPNANTNYPNSDTVSTSYAWLCNGSVSFPSSGWA